MAEESNQIDKTDEVATAEAVDTKTGISEFRRLWNGGERRRAADLAKSQSLSEIEWAALLGEFPELLEVINQ